MHYICETIVEDLDPWTSIMEISRSDYWFYKENKDAYGRKAYM